MNLDPHSLNVLAYLDPGTGSTLIQVLIGAALGILIAVKGYWHKIRTLFNKNKDKSKDSKKSDKDGKD